MVNDAATLPASLRGQDAQGRDVEARLISGRRRRWRRRRRGSGRRCWARATGTSAPRIARRRRRWRRAIALRFGALGGEIVARAPLSPRLVAIRFDADGDALWAALYREARPVQYSYLAHELPLWAVQTVYAGRPWAFEMPSAGRPLSWEILLALRRRGVRWAALTHAAGLSATGDPAIDAALPLPERYDIPAATVAAIAETRRRARAGHRGRDHRRARAGGRRQQRRTASLRAGSGTTDLRIGPHFQPAHRRRDPVRERTPTARATSRCWARSRAPSCCETRPRSPTRAGFHTHELGDSMLIAPGVLADPRALQRPTAATQ